MTRRPLLPLAALALGLSGTMAPAQTEAQDHSAALAQIALFFEDAGLVSGPTEVPCTLSNGTATTCFSITVKADPQHLTPGPWCPTNISDGADKGGIWIDGGKTHPVDGAFIANLATFYGDTDWQLFDPATGAINYTGTLEACQAAARPDVDPAYHNYCVQCLPEYMPADATVTYVIPFEPQGSDRTNPTNMSGSGIAYNGVRLDGPAPLDAILSAHTIAPFDHCGGHVNPHVGYHYHAVTDCLDHGHALYGAVTKEVAHSHGNQIGVAMDGFQIFSHLMYDGTEPTDLDSCNGHEAEDGAYHYHAGLAGSNAILGCLKAEAGCVLEDPNGTCDATKRPPRP